MNFLKMGGKQYSTRTKQELVVICFSAEMQNIPIKATSDEIHEQKSDLYKSLLTIEDIM